MNWIQANFREPPSEPGYYVVKVIQGKSEQFPFMPYVNIKIGRIRSWGHLINKYMWEPTWYFKIEEVDRMRNYAKKGPSIFDKQIGHEERKLLK